MDLNSILHSNSNAAGIAGSLSHQMNGVSAPYAGHAVPAPNDMQWTQVPGGAYYYPQFAASTATPMLRQLSSQGQVPQYYAVRDKQTASSNMPATQPQHQSQQLPGYGSPQLTSNSLMPNMNNPCADTQSPSTQHVPPLKRMCPSYMEVHNPSVNNDTNASPSFGMPNGYMPSMNGNVRNPLLPSNTLNQGYMGGMPNYPMNFPQQKKLPSETLSDEDVAMQLIRLGEPIMPKFPYGYDNASKLPPVAQLQTIASPSMMAPNGVKVEDMPYGGDSLQRQNLVNAQEGAMKRNRNDYAVPPNDYNPYAPRPMTMPYHDVMGAGFPNIMEQTSGLPMPMPFPVNDLKSAYPPVGNGMPPANGAVPAQVTGPVHSTTNSRCARCKRSKKGCDRERPCGRCRDAGLTSAECVSDDEHPAVTARKPRGRGRGRPKTRA
ncbi:transcription factor [Schizosaccharomyces japonicus yFS275]|uniref:Transcription factor n=1 Tax=Schizosaccharomyces japonicus (strain yFS275 / FY16936) TaxID=402676 RepID=B6JVH6_SCHJY|nr:transcription factor [Schizosaccharomyces japonicus yFS275]EEB05377.1 transcription factor [Schizosaccharomyces japonicus yFS275]